MRGIARRQAFEWMAIAEETKTKEAGIDPIVLLTSFPEEAFKTITWRNPVEFDLFNQELGIIADDILQRNPNRLTGLEFSFQKHLRT